MVIQIYSLCKLSDCCDFFFLSRYESLIQTLKECDARLETQCQTHSKQLQKNEKRISKLQGRIKVTAAQLHSIQTEQQGALQQKEKTIKK